MVEKPGDEENTFLATSLRSWNNAKEKQFDKVCDEIVATMDNICASVNICREARAKKPFIHFIATVGSLMTLAWFGNRISKF